MRDYKKQYATVEELEYRFSVFQVGIICTMNLAFFVICY